MTDDEAKRAKELAKKWKVATLGKRRMYVDAVIHKLISDAFKAGYQAAQDEAREELAERTEHYRAKEDT